MAVVRWGLVSTANINRRVIPAIRASARGELVAVASRDGATAAAYAAEAHRRRHHHQAREAQRREVEEEIVPDDEWM